MDNTYMESTRIKPVDESFKKDQYEQQQHYREDRTGSLEYRGTERGISKDSKERIMDDFEELARKRKFLDAAKRSLSDDRRSPGISKEHAAPAEL